MKVIIAGSRDINEYRLVDCAVGEAGFDITEVVSGRARGVDALGELWARRHGIPIDPHPAQWKRYGRRAGAIRNSEMAKIGDALIAVTNGSPGTALMIDFMALLAKPYFVLDISTWPYSVKLGRGRNQ